VSRKGELLGQPWPIFQQLAMFAGARLEMRSNTIFVVAMTLDVYVAVCVKCDFFSG
jgi:hypothetical protein